MPRRSILSAAERESLLALPDDQNELIRRYTFSESDLSVIRRHRGAANRLGFAVQLCYMRHPGVILGPEERPFAPLLCLVAARALKVDLCIRLVRRFIYNAFSRWNLRHKIFMQI